MGTFKNFGFEAETITFWTKGGGSWPGGSAPVASAYLPGGSLYAPDVAEVTVTSVGVDARTDNRLNTVYDGAHAVMINSQAANDSVSVLTQRIDDFTASSLSFAYAAVLQQSHDTGEADGFSLALTDLTTGEVLYQAAFDSRTARDTFTLSSSGWYYENWQTVTIDTGGLRGHDLELTILAYDCSLGGHGGYLYFDGFDLATGTVSGRVFQDYDANGVRDAREPDLSGWTVYADTDGDGVRDAGETSTVTDAHGRYVLNGVAVGDTAIRVDVPVGTWEAWAAQGVTVTVAEDATTGNVDLAVTGGATPFDDTLEGTEAAETIDGLAGADRIVARRGDDVLAGGSGDDVIRGGKDADLIDGGIGDDVVAGGDGDDIVAGGAGADRLRGGAGADVFRFDDAFGRDGVADFSSADGDTIAISVAGVEDRSDLVIVQRGDATIITLAAGGPGQITLRDVLATSLTDDDFTFAPPPPALHAAPLVSELGLTVLV